MQPEDAADVAATAARFLCERHVRCAARGRRVEGLDFDGEARLVPGGWRVEARSHGADPWDDYADSRVWLPKETAAYHLARLCERAHRHMAERREVADGEQRLRTALSHGAPTDEERPTWADSSWEEDYARDRTRVTARIQFGPFRLERVMTARHDAPPVWAWSRIRLTAYMGPFVATQSPWWTWAARQVADGTIPAALFAAAFETGRQFVPHPGDHVAGWYEASLMVRRVEAARQWVERIDAGGPGDPSWCDLPDPVAAGRGDGTISGPAEFDAAAAWAQIKAAFPRLRVYLVEHTPTGTVRAIATTTQERAAELAGKKGVGWEIPSYLPRDEQARLAQALTGAPNVAFP